MSRRSRKKPKKPPANFQKTLEEMVKKFLDSAPKPVPPPPPCPHGRPAWQMCPHCMGFSYKTTGCYEECAIARYFQEHPDETSVMMYCGCRRCTPYFLATNPTHSRISGTVPAGAPDMCPTSWDYAGSSRSSG